METLVELAVGTGTGETEVCKSDSEADAEVAVTGEEKFEGVGAVMAVDTCAVVITGSGRGSGTAELDEVASSVSMNVQVELK